jgi:hypothetical protein
MLSTSAVEDIISRQLFLAVMPSRIITALIKLNHIMYLIVRFVTKSFLSAWNPLEEERWKKEGASFLHPIQTGLPGERASLPVLPERWAGHPCFSF